MFLACLNLLSVANSANIVEYRLGIDFGQVFIDHSGYKNHAVNGNDLTSSDDTWPTDRGAFFDQILAIYPAIKYHSEFQHHSNLIFLDTCVVPIQAK